jgi:hypothetical protein
MVCLNLLDLPIELVVKVIGLCDIKSLYCLNATNRFFKNIIQNDSCKYEIKRYNPKYLLLFYYISETWRNKVICILRRKLKTENKHSNPYYYFKKYFNLCQEFDFGDLAYYELFLPFQNKKIKNEGYKGIKVIYKSFCDGFTSFFEHFILNGHFEIKKEEYGNMYERKYYNLPSPTTLFKSYEECENALHIKNPIVQFVLNHENDEIKKNFPLLSINTKNEEEHLEFLEKTFEYIEQKNELLMSCISYSYIKCFRHIATKIPKESIKKCIKSYKIHDIGYYFYGNDLPEVSMDEVTDENGEKRFTKEELELYRQYYPEF